MFDTAEIKEKQPTFRIVKQEGNELTIVLILSQPSPENRSKDPKTGLRNGKNYVINHTSETLPFTHQGKAVKLQANVLVAVS